MWRLLIINLLILVLIQSENLRSEVEYETLVQIINHSHIDPGWRKTVSTYFYGINYDVDKGHRDDRGGVRNIFRSILSELLLDKDKSFIIGEMAYFHLYYRHSTENIRQIIREYLANGRLEVAGGGYVMVDEAVTYFDDIIDQYMEGHEFLRKTFNIRPIVSWQLDNFGFSAGHLQLSYEMGFKVMYLSRIDWEDKSERQKRKAIEFIWAPLNKNRETPMLIHICWNYYMQPHGYWYDLNVKDSENHEPIRDIEDNYIISLDTNVKQRSEQLVGYFRTMVRDYNDSQVVHLLGNDFSLQSNGQAYENYDRLFNHIKAKKKRYRMNIEYTTPFKTQDRDYELKRSDFFPFRNGKGEFWSGYFTTRSNFKFIVRTMSHYLNAIRTMIGSILLNQTPIYSHYNSTIAFPYFIRNQQNVLKSLNEMEKAVALMQHHDAITGTSYQKVIMEYQEILFNTKRKLQEQVDKHLQEDSRNTLIYEDYQSEFVHCNNNETSTIRSCPMLFYRHRDNKAVMLSIYNSRNYRIKELHRIKVISRQTIIVNQKNEEVMNEIFCVNPFDNEDCEMVFIADLEPISITYFKVFIDKNMETKQQAHFDFNIKMEVDQHKLKLTGQNYLVIQKNLKTFFYKYCPDGNQDSNGCHKILFTLQYGTYDAWESNDNHKDDKRNHNSGSYVYHVDPQATFMLDLIEKGTFHLGTIQSKMYLYGKGGKVQTILTFNYNSMVSQCDNILDWKQVEIESILEPLDISSRGKEMILRINTDWNTEDIFYTDRNGLDLEKRQINKREDYKLQDIVETSCNMYPVTTILQLLHSKNPQNKFSILTDRAQSGGMYRNGSIELLLHRSHKQNDGKGIAEPLVERDESGNTFKIRTHHTLIVQLYPNEQQYHRLWQYYRDTHSLLFHSITHSNLFQQSTINNSPLRQLVKNQGRLVQDKKHIRVWYLPRQDNTTFVRVMNMYDDRSLNLTLPYLFMQELSIQGSWTIEQLIDHHKKYDYKKYKLRNNVTLIDENLQAYQYQLFKSTNIINLVPLQIRTFLVGDSDQELFKWQQHTDEVCQEQAKFYQEDAEGEDSEFLEIDLSQFASNFTNSTK